MKRYSFFSFTSLFLSAIFFISCGSGSSPKTQTNQPDRPAVKNSPDFDADSAYTYVEKQTLFGSRVPNTQAHIQCGDFLVREMERFGAKVIEQKAILKAYNGESLNARNIIGVFNEDKKDRILLFAHWDSRPYADHDPNPDNHKTPVLGANDGASGVGVLMEVARQIGMKEPNIGVDIIFFDAEDYGTPSFYEGNTGEDTWCLGAQYWAVNPHVPGYSAQFGILLDMVGAKNAVFMKEGFSMHYAANYVEKIWKKANELGYGRFFVSENGGYITDDHYYVNRLANIPSVDIIHLEKNSPNGFFEHWHTVNDTMEHIDKETLKAVGQTLLEIVYE